MFKFAFQQILLLCVFVHCIAFDHPTNYTTDLGLYSSIHVMSTCSGSEVGGTYSCNSSCPHRDNFPIFTTPLQFLPNPCMEYSGSQPSSWITNPGIAFNLSTSGCNAHTRPLTGHHYFSLSLWLKTWCYSQVCNVFEIGDLSLSNLRNQLSLDLKTTSVNITESYSIWHFFVIRYNGALSWFVDGVKQNIPALPFSTRSLYNLTVGPKRNLTVSDYIYMVDVRWYEDALTDREILSIYNKTSLDIGLRSECRCPSTHPTLVQNTISVQNLKCTDGSTEVLRLGQNAFIKEYMIDNDSLTKWISSMVTEENITIRLGKPFQIKNIRLEGIEHTPSVLTFILFRNNKQTNVTDVSVSSQTASHNFEAVSITTRFIYESLLADRIVIRAKFSRQSFFTVSELRIETRCNCHGNDKTCVITKGNYTCNCISSSHTDGSHCETCRSEYYRQADDLTCPNPCNCNSTGRLNNNCAQVDGQCSCKTNVIGRQCTKCEHNFANFGSSGCQKCSCYADGITSCTGNLICNCKQNVNNSTGMCSDCLQNYYGITNSTGCFACNCNVSGTVRGQQDCNGVTGQCSCKTNVKGRTCNTCRDKYFGLSADSEKGCEACECNIVGSTDLVCDKTSGVCHCVDRQNDTNEGNRQCVPGNLHLEPTYGPMAGGTLVTLTGTLLGTAAIVSFRLDGVEQPITLRNITHIIFKTKSAEKGEKSVALSWSRGDASYRAEEIENRTSFVYKTNPQLLLPDTDIRSFASGGCTFSNKGSNLDSVARPMMLVHLTNTSHASSACFSEGEFLKCRTPDLHDQNVNKTYSYRFQMDGVIENVTEERNVGLVVVEDPTVYTGMTETYRNTFDKDLRIKGERLNEACQDSDVTIMLGDKNCPVLSRTQDTITCDPEEDFPGTARTVQVKVKIGNFEKVWGELQINSFWTNTEFIFIAIGAGVFLILVVGLVICIVWCRRRGKYDKYKEDSSTAIEMATSNPKARKQNLYERNPVAIIPPLENQAPERTPKMIAEEFCDRLKKSVGKVVKTSLIERSNIDIGKKCTHKGKKIRIINGQYNASTSSPYSGTGITIKTLVESYTETGELPEWLSNGLQECTRLQDFVHDNVLRMRGIAVDAKNIYITYPEMSNRTLKDYLVTKQLTAEKKLEICIQIADGMSFLSSNGVAHKDLAARNCWVSHDFEVKISDASFSYDIYPEEYLENNGRYQPVRWMAPESLRQGFYDTKTDVWSFGVVVWEVYTNGHLPYHDIKSNEEIRTKVCDKEFRLGKPHECPELVFHLILECHKSRSDERPDFSGLQKKFDTILYPPAHDEHLYENRTFTSDHADDSLEDYMNTNFIRPLKPPKGRKS